MMSGFVSILQTTTSASVTKSCLFCTQTIIQDKQVKLYLVNCSSNKPPFFSSSSSHHVLFSVSATSTPPPPPASSLHHVPYSISTTSTPPPSPAFTLCNVPSSAPPPQQKKNQSVMCPHCGVSISRRNVRCDMDLGNKKKQNIKISALTLL